jgi:hypothetical protein
MSETATIRTLASRLQKLHLRNINEIALIGFMLGILYALERAMRFNFRDERMNLNHDDERTEIKNTLEQLALGSDPDERWLSGFYLDSAIMRLAALNERVAKYVEMEHDHREIRRIVNKIKHEVDAGITSGWDFKLSDVLRATDDLCGLLERSIN